MAKFDTNGDGFLDQAEFTAMIEKRAEAMFAKIDTNNDGKISPEEMEAWRQQHKNGGGPPAPGSPPPANSDRFP